MAGFLSVDEVAQTHRAVLDSCGTDSTVDSALVLRRRRALGTGRGFPAVPGRCIRDWRMCGNFSRGAPRSAPCKKVDVDNDGSSDCNRTDKLFHRRFRRWVVLANIRLATSWGTSLSIRMGIWCHNYLGCNVDSSVPPRECSIPSEFSTARFPRPDFLRRIPLASADTRNLYLFFSAHKCIYASWVYYFRDLVCNRDTSLLAQLSFYRASVSADQEQAWKKNTASPGAEPATSRTRTCTIANYSVFVARARKLCRSVVS